MPTFEIHEVDHQILLKVAVEEPSSGGGMTVSAGVRHEMFDALVDTGAQRTFISSNVVSRLGAVPVDVGSFLPADGESQETEVFRLRVNIPYPQTGDRSLTIATGKDLNVMMLPFQPHNFDVLLGLDFLRQFHITMHNGLFLLSN